MCSIVQKKNTEIAILCVAIGFFCRLIYLIEYPTQTRDSYKYESIIYNWEKKGEYPIDKKKYKLTLWILKIPYSVFKCDIKNGAVGINLALGLLLIALIIFQSSVIINDKISLLFIGILAATHPTLIKYSCTLLRENIFLVFLTLALSSLYNYYKTAHTNNIVLFSICGSLAFLSRLEAIEIILLFYEVAFYMFIKHKINKKKLGYDLMLNMLIYLLCIVLANELFDINLFDYTIYAKEL